MFFENKEEKEKIKKEKKEKENVKKGGNNSKEIKIIIKERK